MSKRVSIRCGIASYLRAIPPIECEEEATYYWLGAEEGIMPVCRLHRDADDVRRSAELDREYIAQEILNE